MAQPCTVTLFLSSSIRNRSGDRELTHRIAREQGNAKENVHVLEDFHDRCGDGLRRFDGEPRECGAGRLWRVEVRNGSRHIGDDGALAAPSPLPSSPRAPPLSRSTPLSLLWLAGRQPVLRYAPPSSPPPRPASQTASLIEYLVNWNPVAKQRGRLSILYAQNDCFAAMFASKSGNRAHSRSLLTRLPEPGSQRVAQQFKGRGEVQHTTFSSPI